MHRHHTNPKAPYAHFGHDGAARLKRRQFDMRIRQDFGIVADKDRIAMPADAVIALVEFDGDIRRLCQNEFRRQCRGARPEPSVSLLQRDNISVEFAKDIDNPFGAAQAIKADAFMNVIAGDFDHKPGLADCAVR